MSRQLIKQDLRTIAEIAIVGILGKVPRSLRRSAGRSFANESYRTLQGFPTKNHAANREIIKWIVREYGEYQLSKLSNTNSGTDPENNGGPAESVADELSNGKGDAGVDGN